MYHKSWDGSAWGPSQTGWEALGGTFTSPPAVASWASNRLDIFGLGTDSQMYHKACKSFSRHSSQAPLLLTSTSTPGTGSAWSPSQTDWEALGGTFNSPPSVVSWGNNRLDIFGLGTDNQMYHKACKSSPKHSSQVPLLLIAISTPGTGSAWSPSQTGWEAIGGTFNSDPASVSWSANRLDIFGLGTDNQMYHKAWNGSWSPSQTGWEAVGGTFTSAPAVDSYSRNRLDVFGLGTDKQCYHKSYNGRSWSPSGTGWEAIGGTFVNT
jgi:hypothetical protein